MEAERKIDYVIQIVVKTGGGKKTGEQSSSLQVLRKTSRFDQSRRYESPSKFTEGNLSKNIILLLGKSF